MGDFEQGSVHLERLLEVMRLTSPSPNVTNMITSRVIPLIARITGLADRLEVAEAAAQTVLSSPSVMPAIAQAVVSGLALLAVVRGDAAAAQQQYDRLQHMRGTNLMLVITPVDRLLGLLAHTMGNLDQAVADFEDSLTLCR